MILVCGGAGYIGSHAVYRLLEKGERVVVVDNLQTGHREAVHRDAVFCQGDIRDHDFCARCFASMTLRRSFILRRTHWSVKAWKSR